MRHPAHVVCLIWVLICAAPLWAQAPSHGLLWRSGDLPAVFPLQVKSAPGARYYLRLTPVGEDEATLAAFIEGGRFFRVLVPPGTFRVTLYRGREWQGEQALFGAQTHRIEIAEALTFRIEGLRVKSGHLLDLTQLDSFVQAAPDPLLFCQTLGPAPVRDPVGPRDWNKPKVLPELILRERLC